MSLLSCGATAWSIDDKILIEPGQTTKASFEDFPVFEIKGLPRLTWSWAELNVSRETDPSSNPLLKTREIAQEKNYTVQVTSRSEARDGDAFSLKMSTGKCKQELTFVYHANRKRHPNQILFRSCELRFNSMDPAIPFEKLEAEPSCQQSIHDRTT